MLRVDASKIIIGVMANINGSFFLIEVICQGIIKVITNIKRAEREMKYLPCSPSIYGLAKGVQNKYCEVLIEIKIIINNRVIKNRLILSIFNPVFSMKRKLTRIKLKFSI